MIRLSASPSTLDTVDLARFAADVRQSGADTIHLDLCDGRFAPRLAGSFDVVAALCHMAELPIDVHLLLFEPERLLQELAAIGVSRVWIHVESTNRLQAVVRSARTNGLAAAVAVNPATSVVAVEEILPVIDGILVMTVDPYDPGARCTPSIGRRIFRLRRLAEKWKPGIDISVDGDVPPELSLSLVEMGSTSLVAVPRADQPAAETVKILRQTLDESAPAPLERSANL